MSAQVDRHNRLAIATVKSVLTQTACAEEALVVAESVLVGILLATGGSRAGAVTILDLLTERVIERLPDDFPQKFDEVRG